MSLWSWLATGKWPSPLVCNLETARWRACREQIWSIFSQCDACTPQPDSGWLPITQIAVLPHSFTFSAGLSSHRCSKSLIHICSPVNMHCYILFCLFCKVEEKKPVSLTVQMLPPHITLPRWAVEYICVTWYLCMCLSIPLTFSNHITQSWPNTCLSKHKFCPNVQQGRKAPLFSISPHQKMLGQRDNPCISSSRKGCCLACEKHRGLMIFSKASENFHFKCFQTTDIKDILLRKTNLRC